MALRDDRANRALRDRRAGCIDFLWSEEVLGKELYFFLGSGGAEIHFFPLKSEWSGSVVFFFSSDFRKEILPIFSNLTDP